MAVRCAACSAEREEGPDGAEQRECPQCGYAPQGQARRRPFASLSDSLRPKATLANATRDLFSLSGEHRPVMLSLTNEAVDLSVESEPPPRESQASLLFSLQELSKDGPREQQESLVDKQLWDMKVETPLFGTANDAALLAAPALDPVPGSSPMTVAHSSATDHAEAGYLWWAGGIACTLVLGAAVWWGVSNALQPAEPEPAAAPVRIAEVEAAPEPSPPPEDSSPDAPQAAPPTPEPSAAKSTETVAVRDPERSQVSAASSKTRPPSGVPKKQRLSKKKKASTTPRSGPTFDKSAAKSALSGAAARASECNMPGSAGGTGTVVLTFGTDGRVKNASLAAGRFQGTSVGTCVLSEFRRTKVPAFSGKPVTVKKSFRIR